MPRNAVWALLALAFCLYLPSLNNGYALDDDPIVSSTGIAGNPGRADATITAVYDDSAWDYFTKFFKRHYWYPESHNDGLFRPISVLSYGLVYQAVGKHVDNEAWPQHLVNILVYTWSVWLVLQLALSIGMGAVPSLICGFVFCVHAIHSEVVAGVIGRAEMLAFAFGAQAWLLMQRPAVWRWLLAGLCMFCAFGSKESSVAWIPFLYCLRLAQTWQRQPEASWFAGLRVDALRTALVWALPFALWYLLRINALDDPDYPRMPMAADFSSNPLALSSFVERIATGAKVWGYALLLNIAPFKLSCLYSPHVFSVEAGLFGGWVLLSLAALLGFLFVGLRYARCCPPLFVAMSCFLGFSFLTSNVPMAIGTIFGERLYFTPSLGVCMLPAVLWPQLRENLRKPFLIGLGVWMVGNAVMVVQRTGLWRDSAVLFFHDSDQFPTSIDLHLKSAKCLYQSPDPAEVDRAIAHLKQSIELQPNYTHAHRLMGEILTRRGDHLGAIGHYKQAFGLGYVEPEGAEGLAFTEIGRSYVALGKAAADAAQRAEYFRLAREWFDRSLAAPPFGEHHGKSYLGRAEIFRHQRLRARSDAEARRLMQACIAEIWKCIETQPVTNPMCLTGLRRLVSVAGNKLATWLQPPQIHKAYQLLRQMDPNDADILLCLGLLAYHGQLPAQDVAGPLNHLYTKVRPDRSTWNVDIWTSRLFFAESILEMDPRNRGAAIAMSRELLGEAVVPEETKQLIRQKLSSDPKWTGRPPGGR